MNLRKNTFQLAAANGILLVNNLLQAVVFSRLVGDKTLFGELMQVSLVSSLLSASLASLPNSMNYFSGMYQSETDRTGELIRRFSFVSFVSALLVGGLVLLLNKGLSSFFTNTLFTEHGYLVAGLVFLRLFNMLYPNICLVRGTLHRLIVINLLQCALVFSLVMFKDAQGHIPILLLLWMLIVAEGAEAIAVLVSLAPYFGRTKTYSTRLNLSRAEWNYVLLLLANGVLISVTGQADRVIVSSFSTPATYSDYSLGTFANPVIGVLLASVTTAFIPVLSSLYAKKEFQTIFSLWKNVSEHAAVLIIPIVFFSIFFGKDVVVFLFTARYHNAGILLQLYNFKYLFGFIAFTVTMNAVGLEKYTVVNSLINLASTCIWVFAGLKLFGPTGAVAGGLIVTYLGYIFPVYLIKKKLGGRLPDYFPIKTFTGSAVICVLAGLLFLVLRNLLSLPPGVVVFVMAPLYYLATLLAINRLVLPANTGRVILKKMFS